MMGGKGVHHPSYLGAQTAHALVPYIHLCYLDTI